MLKKQEFRDLFKKTKRLTNNFTKFKTNVFSQNIQRLMILRYILNLNQKKFSKIVKISKGTIDKIENNKKIKDEKEVCIKVLRNLKSDLAQLKNRNITFQETHKKYQKSQTFRRLTSKRAREIRELVKNQKKSVEKLKFKINKEPQNNFELKIFKILKQANITFETQGIIDSINKQVVVDFVIPSPQDPKIILEVKQTKSKKAGNHYDILKTFAITIDHKFYGIKKKFKGVQCLAILSNKEIPIKKLSPYLSAEFLTTDKVFIDSTLHKLPNYILNDNKV